MVGKIAINTLGNGSTVTVRIIAQLPGGEYRVADARETGSDKQLIARRWTWAAPAARLVVVG